MSRATFFIRECPTCGRRLQIRVEYLGRTVQCKHCEAKFEASDPSTSSAPVEPGATLLDRANQLLESYDASRNHPR
ncbi:MAG: response regulator [Pirellulaceae bacterium]